MKDIKFVFFDLDHTLWDYHANSMQALTELYSQFGFSAHVSLEQFLETYQSINEKLWHRFNQSEIDRDYIKKYRFPMVLKKMKVYLDAKPEELHDFFVTNCSSRSKLMPWARETLTYLYERYPLAIITNGFPEAQYPKMEASDLNKYFKEVIISHEVGCRKPQSEIYHLTLEKMGAKAAQTVMSGDNPKTDVRGALDAGLKAIFYNPTGKLRSNSTWEIQSLKELVDIL